jgi:NSS family neurotransmitter:Na+ symporter
MSTKGRGSWTGHVGFILAAAGSAVGLGNIWMFPFRTGENGGAAFVLVYLAAVALVGVPLLVAEIMLGRSTHRNPVGAFRALSPGTPWQLVGWLGVATGFLILSYYGVVAGWALDYAWMATTGALLDPASGSPSAIFDSLVGSVPRQILWQSLFMIATTVVVSRGVEAGIERASKVLMPMLFGLILVLLGYSLTSSGAAEGLNFLFYPRFDELGRVGVLEALGQAFFSLSLGMGAMITYGSYLEPDQSLLKSAFTIALLDTALAILAGLVIFPLVFSFGLEPAGGPGLVFVTLPQAFADMPASWLFSTLFFWLLVFAALTSAISLLEVVVAFVVDEYGVDRTKCAWGLGTAIFLLGLPSVAVEGFLDMADGAATQWMLPLGGLFISLFVGWKLTDEAVSKAYRDRDGSAFGLGVWRLCIKFVAPLAVLLILLWKAGVVDLG